MWNFIKLVVSAIAESVITAVAFAMVVIVILWGVNGFPSATLADFVGLLGWFGGVGTGIVLVMKFVEFAWVVRTLEVRGRAFDSAWDRTYSSLAERDIESARYWLDQLESRRQPLYSILSHCAKWRGANTDVITSTLWQVVDRPNQARQALLETSASVWRPRAR